MRTRINQVLRCSPDCQANALHRRVRRVSHVSRNAPPLDSRWLGCYIHRHGGVAKLVIALACQAGGRGFKSRRSRSFFGRCRGAPSPGRTHGGINRDFQRAVAQLVARSVRDRKAGGSNPPSPIAYPQGTRNKRYNSSAAHQFFQSRPLRNLKAASRPDARSLRIALYWPPLNRPTTGEYCESIIKPRGETRDAISRRYSL